MTGVLKAYKENLYAAGDGGNHLLEFITNMRPSGSSDPGVKRLSELYFDPGYYGIGNTTVSDGGSGISTFLPPEPAAFMTALATNLLAAASFTGTASDSDLTSPFSEPINLFDMFHTALLETCRAQAVVKMNGGAAVTHPNPPTSGFLELINAPQQNFEDAYTTPLAFRPYFAWKYIDEVYPEAERREYYLIERMHVLTKFVFILFLLHPTVTKPAEGSEANMTIFLNWAMTLLVKLSLELTSIGDPDSVSIDDSATKNVELSNRVRQDSEVLLKNKGVVQRAQDNLRSLVDVDRHVQASRNRAWYLMVVLIVVLAASVAGMAAAYSRGYTGEVYLVASILLLGVLSFEAFNGAEQLFSLPTSVLE